MVMKGSDTVLDVNQDGIEVVSGVNLVDLVHQTLAVFKLLLESVKFLCHGEILYSEMLKLHKISRFTNYLKP